MLSFRESKWMQIGDAQRAPRERCRRAIEARGRVVRRLGRVPISQHILSAYHDPSLQAPITPKARWLCRVTPINDNHVFGHPPRDHGEHPSLSSPPLPLWRLGSLFSLSTPSIFIRGAAAPLLADPTTISSFVLHSGDDTDQASSIEQRQRSLTACGFCAGF